MNPLQGAIDSWSNVAEMYHNLAQQHASDPNLVQAYQNQVNIFNNLISQHGGTPVSFAPLSQPAPTPTPAPAPAPLSSVAPEPAAPVQSPLQAVSQPVLDSTTLHFQNLANDFQRKANDPSVSVEYRRAMQSNADIYKNLASERGATSFEQVIDYGPQLGTGSSAVVNQYTNLANDFLQKSQDPRFDPATRENYASLAQTYQNEIKKVYESEGVPLPSTPVAPTPVAPTPKITAPLSSVNVPAAPAFVPNIDQIISSLDLQNIQDLDRGTLGYRAAEASDQVRNQGLQKYMEMIGTASNLRSSGQISSAEYDNLFNQAQEFNRLVGRTADSVKEAILNKDLSAAYAATSSPTVSATPSQTNLETEVNELALAYLGRNATPEELQKYASIYNQTLVKSGNAEEVLNQIEKSLQQEAYNSGQFDQVFEKLANKGKETGDYDFYIAARDYAKQFGFTDKEIAEKFQNTVGRMTPFVPFNEVTLERLDVTNQTRNIYDELKNQYEAISEQANYNYPHKVDTILYSQAEALANLGVKSVYDITQEKRDLDQEIPITSRYVYSGRMTDYGEPEYVLEYGKFQGYDENGNTLFTPLNEYEKANVKVNYDSSGEGNTYYTTKTKVPGIVAIDRNTGKELFQQYEGKEFTIGAVAEPGGTGRLDLMFTEEGIPLMVPVFQPAPKKKNFFQQIAPFVAVAFAPFIPGIGAALAPSLAPAAQAAIGAAAVNAGVQLAGTGKIDVGNLALSAAGAYVGATANLTAADIAADAAQLAAQGLDAAQIANTISATGVNSVTATVAAQLATAGVDAAIAPMITSSALNAGLYGLNAAASGKDISEAMMNGALIGAAGQASEFAVDELIGADTIAAVAKEMGLSQNQLRNLSAMSLANALNAEIIGQGDFGEVLAMNFVAGGASFAAANRMSAAIQDKVPEKTRAGIVTATQELTSVATQAAMQGRDIGDVLKEAAPFIATKAAVAAIQAPSLPAPKPEERPAEQAAGEQKPPPEVVPDTKSPSVSGIPDGSGFKTPEEAMQWAKSLGESKVTWDGKVYEETSAKTVTGIPDGSGFTSPQEAIKWANSMGENKVVWGGQIYQNKTLTETLKDIESAKTFDEAYSKARNALGSGVIFDWNGKKYTTDTREENKALAEASDRIRNIEQGVGGPKGTYTGYDEKEMANLLAMIDDNAINKAVSRPSGEVDFITDAITGKQTPVYGDKISKDLMAPVVTAVGVAVRGAGSITDFTAGFLRSIEVIDKNSPMVKVAKDLKELGEFQMGSYLLNEEKQVVKIVAEAEDFNKIPAVVEAIIKHPAGILSLIANEAIEESPSFIGMLATGGVAGIAKLLALAPGALINFAEGAGANYNETNEKALAAGLSKEEAHRQAQKSAAAAGATQAVLGTFGEAALVKRAFGEKGTLGTAVKREVVTEIPEEFAQTGFTDYFGTGAFDMNNALTAAVLAPVIAAGTVTGIGTAISVARSGDATTEVLSAVAPENASAALGQIDSALQTSASIQEASQKIIPSLESLGFNPEQSVSIANTVATEQFLANINANLPADSKFSVDTVNVLIGASANGNPITLGDYIGATLTDRGEQMFVSPDLVIGTKNDGSLLTVADISGQITSLNPKTGQETQTSSQTDPATGATTTIKVSDNPGTGTSTETTTETDPSTNTNSTSTVTTTPDTTSSTDTVVNSNTNTQVDVNSKVDTNTNTTTTTAVTTNTNTNTSVAIDIDSLISSLVAGGMSPIEAIKVATEEVKNAAKRGTLRAGAVAGSFGLPMAVGYDESDFEHPSLYTYGPKPEFESPLETFLRQVEQNRAVDAAQQAQEEKMQPSDYFSYGQPQDIDQILAPSQSPMFDALVADFNAPLADIFGMKAGGIVPAFEAGGLTGPLTVAAGKVRRDYRQGDAVEGPGDGQSDDIPAMLADGEFVIPADVVAALGNGSNKAGADKLYEMMHNVRREHRKGKPQDLPKPAKSPLQYIKRRA